EPRGCQGGMVVTKEQIVARANELCKLCIGHVDGRADPQHVLTGALTLMAVGYGDGSQEVKALLKQRDAVVDLNAPLPVKKVTLTDSVRGALTNLMEDVNAGFLTSVERRVTSDVLSDLIQLARVALAENTDGSKNVAAVL